jgi:hypothetical protein
MSCEAVPDAFLDARLAGALDAEIHWRGPALGCDGTRRPDGQGLRVSFTGSQAGERLTLVFGVPHLAEGADGRAIPVNVTLIREGRDLYGTQGEGKCLLDEVRQSALAGAPPDPPPAGVAGPADAPAPAPRLWRIDARGFCLEPARSIGDGRDAILLATFDFRGQLTWEQDPPEQTPLVPPPAAKGR